MPNDPEKLAEARKTAVIEAEAQTSGNDQYVPGEMPEVIDSNDEEKAFYLTAYRQLTRYIDETGDQLLKDKKKELEKVHNDYLAGVQKFSVKNEKMADQYWQSLIGIVEREERQAIKHGKNLLKDLGIPDDYKLVEYGKYTIKEGEVNEYKVSKDFFVYELNFFPDGRISMYINSGIHADNRNFFHLYRSEKTSFGGERGYMVYKKDVSLSGLKDLSSFKIYISPLGNLELQDILRDLISIFDNLPKRSTDPGLIPLIALRDEMEKLRNDSFDEEKNSLFNNSQDKCDQYFAKIKEFFKKCLRYYFGMPDKSDAKAGDPARILLDLVNKFPILIDPAMEEVKTLEELQFFNFSEEQNYFHAKVELKRSTLTNTDVEKEKVILNKYGLSEEQKSFLISLRTRGFVGVSEIPKIAPLLEGNLHTGKIETFVLSHPQKFKEVNTVVIFIKYSRSLSFSQFEKYRDYFIENNIYEYKLRSLSSVLREYGDDDGLRLAYSLYLRGVNVSDIKGFVSRIKKLLKMKALALYSFLEYMEKVTPYEIAPLITAFEILDSDYLSGPDYSFLAVIKTLPPSCAKAVYFNRLNALKPFQRKALSECRIVFFNEKDVDAFLTTLEGVSTSAEMGYLRLAASLFQRNDVATGQGKPSSAAVKSIGPVEEFADIANKSTKYKGLFTKMDQIERKNNKPYSESAYYILKLMIDKSFDQKLISDMLEDLFKIVGSIQKQTLALLMTPGNARNLMKIMAGCGKQCKELETFFMDSAFNIIYGFGLGLKPNLSEILPFITKLLDIKAEKDNLIDSTIFDCSCFAVIVKTITFAELLETLDLLSDPKLVNGLQKIVSDNGNVFLRSIIYVYFKIAVKPADLKDPQKVLNDLDSFVKKAVKNNYVYDTDPGLNRAASFLDPLKLIEKPDTEFTHIAFILNVLRDSSPSFSKEALAKIALNQLNNKDSALLREKGAKILIGLGTMTQDIGLDVLIDIAKIGVDGKLTKFTISDKITSDQLKFLCGAGIPKIPLSLFFSFLITLEKTQKSRNQQAFEALVNKYKTIAKEKVYQNQVLILSHNPADKAHSYLFSMDGFNPESHQIFARDVQKLHVEALRHGVDDESVESMFSKLELTKGDLTLVIGGHGSEGYISYGGGGFSMYMLFERLKKRVGQQKSGSKWKTTIIFESCHSDFNAGLINGMWLKDAETRDYPIMMLSSSNENMPNAKMANDSWTIVAREAKKNGQPLTWEVFYRDIESRNFIMTYGDLNSNQTLFIDGIELGEGGEERESHFNPV